METTANDPATALAVVLSDPHGRVPADVLAFVSGGLADLTDVTDHFPATFASAGGTIERRLFSATSRRLQQAVLSVWRSPDGGARGVVIVGSVRDLPGPPAPPEYTGPPPGAGYVGSECYDVRGNP